MVLNTFQKDFKYVYYISFQLCKQLQIVDSFSCLYISFALDGPNRRLTVQRVAPALARLCRQQQHPVLQWTTVTTPRLKGPMSQARCQAASTRTCDRLRGRITRARAGPRAVCPSPQQQVRGSRHTGRRQSDLWRGSKPMEAGAGLDQGRGADTVADCMGTLPALAWTGTGV